MPDLASRREATTSWVLLPMGETMPMPVTATRLMELLPDCLRKRAKGLGRCRGSGLVFGEQADAQILGLVDHLAVHLHDAVGDAHHQPAHDHALEVDILADE